MPEPAPTIPPLLVDDGQRRPMPAGNALALRPPFIRQLPDWIYADPAFAALGPAERWQLHALAWRCNAPDASGSMIGGFVGNKALSMVGGPRSSFWARYRLLESAGYLVTISHGGGRLANVVGIPGRRGALDDRRVERRAAQAGKGGSTPQKYTPLASSRRTLTVSVQPADGCRPANDSCRPIGGRYHLLFHQPEPSSSPPAAATPPGNGDDALNSENAGKAKQSEAASLKELLAIGVHAPVAKRLATTAGISAASVRALFVGVPATFQNKALWCVQRIEAGQIPHRIDPKAMAGLVNRGQVTSIDGVPIKPDTSAKWNDGGLYLTGSDGQQTTIAAVNLLARLVRLRCVAVSAATAPDSAPPPDPTSVLPGENRHSSDPKRINSPHTSGRKLSEQ